MRETLLSGRLQNQFFQQMGLIALLLVTFNQAARAEIKVTNLKDGETLRYPIAFLRGTTKFTGQLKIVNRDNDRPDGTNTVPVEVLTFKVLVELRPGVNHLELSEGDEKTQLTLKYQPMTTPYRVNVLYVGASDGDMNYPAARADDPQNYAERLDTALKLMQTFTAERLHDAGFDRKTFPLDLDANGKVVMHPLRFPATAEELKKLNSTALWQKFYPWSGQQFNEDKNKCLIITLYVGGALGAGHQAMFGAIGLHVWPTSIRDTYRAFTDTTPIDSTKVQDDSVGRSVAWGQAATTMGAALHELGHTFGLEHSPIGESIMSRGFDHFNRFFTVVEPPSKANPNPMVFAESAISEWEVPYAARMSVNPWFQPDPPTVHADKPPQIKFEAKTQSILITAPYGIKVIEFKPPLERADSTPQSGQYKLFKTDAPTSLRYTRDEVRKLAGSPAAAEIAVTDREGNTVIVNEATLNGNAEGVFDAKNDFNPAKNPNGAWRYGMFSPDANPNPNSFQDYQDWTKGFGGLDVRRYPGNADPNVTHNGTARTVNQQSLVWEPNTLTLLPSWQGFYSVVRWTCPKEGKYRVEAVFQGADTRPTTTDVHLFQNTTALFDGMVEGIGAAGAKRFEQTLQLKPGDTLDFVVGWGRNKNNDNDATALDAKIVLHP